MKVFEKNEIVASEGLIVMIYGDPGIGKTTLANTAPNPVLLDFDRGAHRASLGKKTIQFDSWQDVLENQEQLSQIISEADSLIIDTAGTLLDSMSSHLISTQPTLAKSGIKLWGELKKMFSDFFLPLKSMNKNIIFIAHAKEKEEGDFRIKRPLIQGSSYDLLMQSCDLVGYYTASGTKRILTFDLSDTVTAKNCAEIEPIVIKSVPTMTNQLSEIIEKTKKALVQRNQDHSEAIQKVAVWEELAKTIEPSEIYQRLQDDKSIKKTEKTAIWAKVVQVMSSRGYEWNTTSKTFQEITQETSNG
jgi:nucleoside-triphosphatase THEP1